MAPRTKKPKVHGALYRVWLMDEIHGIPSGQRVVDAEVGRKWVYVRLVGAPRARRISVTQWLAIGAALI